MISFDLEKQFDEYKEAHKLLVISNRKEHNNKKIEFEKIEQKLFDKIRDLIEDASKHNKDIKQARIVSVDEFGNYISLTD